MINEKNIFGKRLRALRQGTFAMNQRKFAEMLEIPQTTLSAYETGRTKPTMDAAINISEKCDVTIDWLFGRDTKSRNIEVEAHRSAEEDAPDNDNNDYVIKATIYLSFK